MSDKYPDVLLDDKFVDIQDSLVRIEKQTTATNGHLRLHDRLLWLAMGAIPLLSVWAWFLTMQVLDGQKQISPLQQAVIIHAVDEAFKNNKE